MATVDRLPAYRNLRVWAESFDLALDVMRVSRDLPKEGARTTGRRLVESSARIPATIARGQASGSASAFTLALHEAISDLAEVETHLLVCGEAGMIPAATMSRFETRLRSVRRMVRALIRRLAARPAVPEGSIRVARRRERGSSILVAMLVAATLGIIGLTLLQVADGESLIASRARDRDVLIHAAETGARAVKRWFDAPVSGDPGSPRHAFLGTFDPRDASSFIMERRLVDHDGDGRTARVTADGTSGRERYRQGRFLAAGFPHLDLFHKPLRGSIETSLLGLESGPDLVLEDRPGAVDLLDRLNAELFTDQRRTGRIERIEVYAPPSDPAGARLGVATIRVTAALWSRMESDTGLPVVAPAAVARARAVVRMGLAEIPSNAPRGPLEACRDLTATGRLRAHWGRVMAGRHIRLADTFDRLDTTVSSGFPYASYGRRISGAGPGGDLSDWLDDPDDTIEDPWLKVVAGGDLLGWSSRPDHPFPYNPAAGIDYDHSNLFQRVPGIGCPSFDYDLWKAITTRSMPGDRNVRYFAWDSATSLFKEDGRGAARSVRDWTHGQHGIFFFDTRDGRPPTGSNLTPPVVISGGDWSTAGIIHLNAVSFAASSVRGTIRVIVPPGEPFDDGDHDGQHDPTEVYVNFRYATTLPPVGLAGEMLKDPASAQSARAESPDGEAYTVSTTTGRDPRGIPLLAEVNIFGVLFNSGDILAEGDAVHFGSLVAGRDVIQSSGADTQVIYFDERLNSGEWPPPEIDIPRTYVTFWQTSRP